MENNPVPQQLVGFMAYEDNGALAGVTDITMPNIQYMTESIKGAGIAGEIDVPVNGQTQSMRMTLNFRDIIPTFLSLASHKGVSLTCYGSLQMQDPADNSYTEKQIKVVVRGKTKNSNMGKFDVGTANGTSIEIEVTYLKVDFDGQERIEIDKLNYIHKVDGFDYLALTRQNLGL